MNVSAIIVTRGDVPMDEILTSLTASGIDDIVVWDNSKREDLAVYGRYAAIAEAKHDLIYVQDDDCVVSNPWLIANEWDSIYRLGIDEAPLFPEHAPEHSDRHVVCNMPPEFRHDFYREHALVGFGACFHRDAPQRAFDRLGLTALPGSIVPDIDFFYRTCDIVFTALTPRVLVDVPYKNMWWAEDETRMYRQESHVEERTQMLNLVRQVRDA